MKASLVVTTINDSNVLDTYFENFEAHGHLHQVRVIAIPDRKTPQKAFETWSRLKARGMDIVYPGLEEQDAFLDSVGYFADLVPYNSDARRNVGYLMSLGKDIDFVMSIDDDNYATPEYDYFLESSVVCAKGTSAATVRTSNGWFNICGLMESSNTTEVYPRGFPYYARHLAMSPDFAPGVADVHINAGLWLNDPDVDGMTWLIAPTRMKGFPGKSLLLSRDCWTPVNTQNTALRREAVAAYLFVKMGYSIGGIGIERYGDIFSGYFVQACAKHLNGGIRVGSPVVEHRRNKHDYLYDASHEMGCIQVLEDLLPWLTQDLKLEGSTYTEAYNSLSELLEERIERMHGSIWTDPVKGYFHQLGFYMRNWARACNRLGC